MPIEKISPQSKKKSKSKEHSKNTHKFVSQQHCKKTNKYRMPSYVLYLLFHSKKYNICCLATVVLIYKGKKPELLTNSFYILFI